MIDIQSKKDDRGIEVNWVGITHYRYPIHIEDKVNDSWADITFLCNLSREKRGAHMSRFIELINTWEGKLNSESLNQLLQNALKLMETDKVKMLLYYTMFMEKQSPVTKKTALYSYNVQLEIEKNRGPWPMKSICKMEIPIASVCPCSKAISSVGAHNQRGFISAKIYDMDVEAVPDMVKKIEECSSIHLFPLLKREDEKYVTEHGYENAKFVEDIVRDIKMIFSKENINKFKVSVETFESIHAHNVYAYIEQI